MILEINLPQDRFQAIKLEGLKQKNFIYGKNGTGKSSITKAIDEQYSNSYDVRIFQGFDSIVDENTNLNAIALGTENVELQPQIDEIQKRIDNIIKDISQPKKQEMNSYQKLEDCKNRYNDKENELKRFFSQSASKIKNSHTDWTGANYNTQNFQQDISKSKELSEEEVEKNLSVFKQENLTLKNKIEFPFINISKYIDATNEILQKEVLKSVILDFKNEDEQKWVREGLQLHEHNAVEKCIFCDNPISEQRINNLNSYFNDEVKAFENRINKAIDKLQTEKTRIVKIQNIDKSEFYPKFHEEVTSLNLEVTNLSSKYSDFFTYLIEQLEIKKGNVFVSLDSIEYPIPESFENVQVRYNNLLQDNLQFSTELSTKKQVARDKLRLNEVFKCLKSFEYEKQKENLLILENLKNKAREDFDKQKQELSKLKLQLQSLLQQTVDESKAARNINKDLELLGGCSFKLVLIDGEQKGQYQIKNLDDTIRNVNTLSTGEKNIVAFLWFLNSLKDPNGGTLKDRIIVFDDPMNSNDDTVQYLIISKLQKLLRNIKNEQIFILTHNIHFYSNVRYKWWQNQKSKKATFHLKKYSGKTEIELIDSEENDLKTSYQALWSELHWLYKQKKPEFMHNSIRRIFETYINFNELNDRVIDEQDIEIEKMINVNSHGLIDLEDLQADLNGKNEQEIIAKVKAAFISIGGESHFNAYWKEE
ncbi:AAA family ATPase [Streptococcus mutans]|uniref:AAA family ATPase n=1 Tax=Streptococcus mutans TaxID=1309 RepID=A0AAX1K3R0_STRMG|nr:AAA family ATPase [Streptococcus mutans]EMB86301.1 hypothetical protein SMU54_03260 [Streptococcus mutans A9]QQL47726.1 AAA family ATPase [Streptococcus mutans]